MERIYQSNINLYQQFTIIQNQAWAVSSKVMQQIDLQPWNTLALIYW